MSDKQTAILKKVEERSQKSTEARKIIEAEKKKKKLAAASKGKGKKSKVDRSRYSKEHRHTLIFIIALLKLENKKKLSNKIQKA